VKLQFPEKGKPLAVTFAGQIIPPSRFFDRPQIDPPLGPQFAVEPLEFATVHRSQALKKSQQVTPIAIRQGRLQTVPEPTQHLAKTSRPVVMEQPAMLADTTQGRGIETGPAQFVFQPDIIISW
jgi:hypothetical protein